MSDLPFWYTQCIEFPSESSSVCVDGIEIAFETWGEVGKPGIVLIHGSNAHLSGGALPRRSWPIAFVWRPSIFPAMATVAGANATRARALLTKFGPCVTLRNWVTAPSLSATVSAALWRWKPVTTSARIWVAFCLWISPWHPRGIHGMGHACRT